MCPVERLFSEPPEATVVNCDWCGAPAIVCTAAERQAGDPPTRIGLCEEHHAQLLSATAAGAPAEARAAYERRRLDREAELRRQRSDWRRRKAARRLNGRLRSDGPPGAAPGAASGGELKRGPDEPPPQDSEELVQAIMQGERTFAPVDIVDPRLEDPRRSLERMREALAPLVQLAEECGIYIDCNPSQTHSVLVVGEVPVQALFRARDLLKRER